MELSIYNMLGQKIVTLVNKKQNAGAYSVRWNGRNADDEEVANGVYLLRISARPLAGAVQAFVQVRKMVLVR